MQNERRGGVDGGPAPAMTVEGGRARHDGWVRLDEFTYEWVRHDEFTYRGDRTITIWRFSIRGICSTLEVVSISDRIRSSTRTPMSW
jgi:hypothetical protein